MKTLLKNARLYDGSGQDPYLGDLLFQGDRILAVGRVPASEDARVIDLKGLSLAPGFVDAHSHNDWFAIKRDPLPYFAPFIQQGITSFVTGNCGISAAGFSKQSPHIAKVGAGLFNFDDTVGQYGGVGEYFSAIAGKTPCNIAALLGHGSARASVAGAENRALTPDEMKDMLAILENGLKEGACGLSLGLMYVPGLFAPIEELKAVARLCEKYDRPLTVHPRACSKVSMAYPQLLGRPHLLRALDELHEIARGTKLKLQYSHAIFVGRSSFGCKDEFLRIIEAMRQEGIDCKFDIYHEMLGVSIITVVMPPWYQALGQDKKRSFFNKLRFTLLAQASMLLLGFNFSDIVVAYLGEGLESYEGKTVAQIAGSMRVSGVEAYLRLCEMSHYRGRVNMGPYSTPDIIKDLARHEQSLFMTDAWVEEKGIQNPAIYDVFPKFLKQALSGQGDTLPHTIRKMTGATADRFSLKDRGYLREDAFADLTVFDEQAVKDGIPDIGKPFGIRHVFINGRHVLKDGQLDPAAAAGCGQAMPSR
ncbi:MAG: amidohydrolase family protein [Christensenellales bacterium]